MPTGSGKTIVFCHILKSITLKNKKAIIVVRGRKLVDQASKRLDNENVPHGVLMAGHWRNQPSQNIQVCSIDTLYSRKINFPAELIIIDEAHQATSKGYKWLADQYPNAFFLAVTATPFCNESLRHIADKIITSTSFNELIDLGFLVPPKYFCPSIPDLTGVKTSNKGDFVVAQLDEILNTHNPISDIVSVWKKSAEHRPTLCFAVSLAHSQSIVAAFNSAGIQAEHIESDHSDKERQGAISRLESGEIKVISNVGIFGTGVDIPAVSCLILARPTKSYSLYIQQCGRGSRISENKKDFIILDHSGNVLRHGLITEEREGSLDPLKKTATVISGLSRCGSCFAVYKKDNINCPLCGFENERSGRSESGKLEIKTAIEETTDHFHLQVIAKRGHLYDTQKRKGYKKAWVHFKLLEQFGKDIADQYAPLRKIPPHILERLKRATFNSGK